MGVLSLWTPNLVHTFLYTSPPTSYHPMTSPKHLGPHPLPKAQGDPCITLPEGQGGVGGHKRGWKRPKPKLESAIRRVLTRGAFCTHFRANPMSGWGDSLLGVPPPSWPSIGQGNRHCLGRRFPKKRSRSTASPDMDTTLHGLHVGPSFIQIHARTAEKWLWEGGMAHGPTLGGFH